MNAEYVKKLALPEEVKEPRLSLLYGGKIFEISAKRF